MIEAEAERYRSNRDLMALRVDATLTVVRRPLAYLDDQHMAWRMNHWNGRWEVKDSLGLGTYSFCASMIKRTLSLMLAVLG